MKSKVDQGKSKEGYEKKYLNEIILINKIINK